jgi:hypothetical protein
VAQGTDPRLCIIDYERDIRGFNFINGEGPDSIVAGLTITNGYAVNGGGVRCDASNPTLTHCTISGNSAHDDGDVDLADLAKILALYGTTCV